MLEVVHFLQPTKVLTKSLHFFLNFGGIFAGIFGKNRQITCVHLPVPTGQFFGENCEIWSPILQKMAPKIGKLGEIYAQTLNLKVRIHHFSKITENI